MEVDDVAQDPVSAVGESTGGISVVGGMQQPPIRNGHLTKSDWIRIAIWAIPILFMAATMFVSVNALSERSKQQDEHLGRLDDKTSDLAADQRVTSEKVTRVERKVDKLDVSVEKIDDKMDGASLDLAAIKEKLKIRDGS